MKPDSSMLETFDHVVVLMLENRSFDNVLGYLYPDGVPSGAPLGKRFEGVSGKKLWNPDQSGAQVPVSVGTDYHQPYPDPGEEFGHVTAQIFGPRGCDGASASGASPGLAPGASSGLASGGSSGPDWGGSSGRASGEATGPPATTATSTPTMKGFVDDYHDTLQALKQLQQNPWDGSPAEQSKRIMECFDPQGIPVLSRLATEFAVFDHWFCGVPSQTWCNRAFWHAATSWGWVNNPAISPPSDWDLGHWAASSAGKTLFDLIEGKFGAGSWRIYGDLAIYADLALTKLVHWGDLKDKLGDDYFGYLEYGERNFFTDCASGSLPKYSFVEPRFMNWVEMTPWHDDMHPSSWDSVLFGKTGPGSVLRGDQLVWKVYQAIRNSASLDGSNWRNTLLIITFDEHGGCYDHVAPPAATPPDREGFNTGEGECGFDFGRLGVRVPTVMISAHIAKNTVVNDPKQHTSFLKTMQQKWGLDSLGPRQDSAAPFTDVFTSPEVRPLDEWPDWQNYPGPVGDEGIAQGTIADAALEVDLSKIPLNDLQASILGAMAVCLADDAEGDVRSIGLETAGGDAAGGDAGGDDAGGDEPGGDDAAAVSSIESASGADSPAVQRPLDLRSAEDARRLLAWLRAQGHRPTGDGPGEVQGTG